MNTSPRRLLILGAGTAGTIVANKLSRELPPDDWRITIIDQNDTHHYQPGFLFVPFQPRAIGHLTRSRRALLRPGVDFLQCEVDGVDPDAQTVHLSNGRSVPYDYLLVATGCQPRPDQTPGMLGPRWRSSVHEFYTVEGAYALRSALRGFTEGRLAVHVTDVPFKCPVAPLEFTFLVDDLLRRLGRRDRVQLTYVTPMSGAFTKPVASQRLGSMLADRGIALEPDFYVDHIDQNRGTLVSYDEREVGYDLLVTVPLNMGAGFVGRSDLGDELNYVPVDPHTLRSRVHPNVFAIGDAADLPTSKAGSVAHYAAEVFTHNFLNLARGRPFDACFDGHANCFIESGRGKALLIDFDYDHEPLPGRYPFRHVGPLSLLDETRANHVGKLAFQWLYWNVLLPGHPLPVPSPHASSPTETSPAVH
ncbi:MAG TPA: FAD-dependent oxidoreductase [Segeticoccus sp.]|uniref:type III sulfide quinone reductase, selenoprotein subtype n=1 Tax=Segeticoccus sp. TaxID=2706531 RepID=UPI002D80CEFD|nr:FAD-dependent oxidoreductase [Segeticoccus sp.]HET8600994.1 FAD-dependent oxidoreductase [Segeticoccus sp.]